LSIVAIVFFDTSALLKLCVRETGTPLAAALWNEADAVVVSRIADVEVRAALGAARRARLLSADGAAVAAAAWAGIAPSARVVEYAGPVPAAAAALAARHAIRAGDAIQVASAALLGPAGVLVAAWDGAVASAAQAEGLAVLPRPASSSNVKGGLRK
jgi:predicted nucleic acid-binding protein